MTTENDYTTPAQREALESRTLDDGRTLDVVALGYGYAHFGIILPEDAGLGIYSDAYQYQSREAALEALRTWDGTEEPPGWYRHYHTGRRRPDGDPAKEFVRK